MTLGEVFSIFLSLCLILISSIIFHILVKYYDSINFTQRNTVTYLSLHLIYICYTSVLSLVRVIIIINEDGGNLRKLSSGVSSKDTPHPT